MSVTNQYQLENSNIEYSFDYTSKQVNYSRLHLAAVSNKTCINQIFKYSSHILNITYYKNETKVALSPEISKISWINNITKLRIYECKQTYISLYVSIKVMFARHLSFPFSYNAVQCVRRTHKGLANWVWSADKKRSDGRPFNPFIDTMCVCVCHPQRVLSLSLTLLEPFFVGLLYMCKHGRGLYFPFCRCLISICDCGP